MIRKVLIANRGEIALRVLRACRELGIPAVVAYSEADRESLPVRLADEAICIGPAPAERSYNHIPAIISAAVVTGCDALHPGYGFLAENALLAEICEECGITFIGPRPQTLRALGDKAEARRLMQRAGLPIVPGSETPVRDASEARRIARKLGYPVLVKAAAGGGGRGMRIVREERELATALQVAQQEAQAAFGDPSVYLERYLERPRHVEVQILADQHGNIVAVGERDCSIQRRYQKLIEEAPAPDLSARVRDALHEAAVRGARAVGYVGAGTFEFLVDREGHFYFTEANARLQVEHPVTEAVTGLDLVQWQLAIAAGERLALRERDLAPRGHAIEVRVTAEDPDRDFAPRPGRIEQLVWPGGPGIRVDSHAYAGYVVPPHYDSLLGKVIAWGLDRAQAIERLDRALRETIIDGVPTPIPLLRRILQHPDFRASRHTTTFLAEYLASQQS
ncbi:acetyl-CoA carboxylase biotin carboxylase subunit [Thermomicrobium sp.]|jgi:acetyl-CoA carboxylase biotin carboxylase subunit|uniref:acetyl-CoA carboxylase biotin carboxylase subunit n=1 Tax=Thermomicrobium sp. TaxID=1969469 RepID=UPI001B0E3FDF|nr:acetyl-CoA carboxylase biotin carboxylase subunit [Thermomicrobium sp.]MBO9307337.1 acetyl-CoA carboxylase biotin carboxylase subunit [Thermomicrobium sp.]MBO9358889.1 acetyl-CoA carboxylase biotin carboxylase subunit [Thermomicrobium sp.]MBO9385672.1 acetyl-CoA carboxylase biotin carboxylase subunit [Thermomicrobium sp.]